MFGKHRFRPMMFQCDGGETLVCENNEIGSGGEWTLVAGTQKL